MNIDELLSEVVDSMNKAIGSGMQNQQIFMALSAAHENARVNYFNDLQRQAFMQNAQSRPNGQLDEKAIDQKPN